MGDYLNVPGQSVVLGDCLEVLRGMPDESVTAVVTDPPYGLSDVSAVSLKEVLESWIGGDTSLTPKVKRGYAGLPWDGFVPTPELWEECVRVLKPGGLMCVFASSRTVDLMGVSIRLGGGEVVDTAVWVHGDGGVGVVPPLKTQMKKPRIKNGDVLKFTARLRESAERLGVTAKQVDEAAGTKGMAGHWLSSGSQPSIPTPEKWEKIRHLFDLGEGLGVEYLSAREADEIVEKWGGWRNRLRGDHEPIIVARKPTENALWYNLWENEAGGFNVEGLKEMSGETTYPSNVVTHPRVRGGERKGNPHPTVKPVDVMRWLLRMVAVEGGVVLDPFVGSGTTLVAAKMEGIDAVGVEMDEGYYQLASERLRATPVSGTL